MFKLMASSQGIYSEDYTDDCVYDVDFCYLLIEDEESGTCHHKWCEGKLHLQPWGKTGKISDDEFYRLFDMLYYPLSSLPGSEDLIPFVPQQ